MFFTDHKKAILIRDKPMESCVLGMLYVDGNFFYTLERPWLNNAQNISCIPSGSYQAEFLERSASGKYHNVYHVLEVEGRGGILIHNGNLVSHTLGCILIGKSRGKLTGQPAVLNSRTALYEFVELLDQEPFEIEIFGG